MTVLDDVLADLRAESEQLRAAVAALPDGPDGWRRPTPAEGWDVAHQIAHLAWTDEASIAAATDKPAWDALVTRAIENMDGFVDEAAAEVADVPAAELLMRWDTARARLAEVLAGYQGKLPWFGPPMSPTSMATARLMETWAHAQDVYGALGAVPVPTDRIRHIAYLGFRTRDFAYASHDLEPPTEQFRVELTAPSGELWTFGPEDAPQRVTGPAYDFCLLVTQRIHRDDTDLRAEGAGADTWLSTAQAFAGPRGKGREKA